MSNEQPSKVKTGYKHLHRHFAARNLQISVALIIVVSLLGGIFLQSISSILSLYFGLSTTTLSILLIIGYVLIIAFLAALFAYRFVGPFKRLEYEMKTISRGNFGKRLSLRTNDDLHIRSFVTFLNEFIDSFEEMSKEYNKISSTITSHLGEIEKKLDKEPSDCDEIKKNIKDLQRKIHEFRERW
jgi:methyl-accepting chemotaxis protein